MHDNAEIYLAHMSSPLGTHWHLFVTLFCRKTRDQAVVAMVAMTTGYKMCAKGCLSGYLKYYSYAHMFT